MRNVTVRSCIMLAAGVTLIASTATTAHAAGAAFSLSDATVAPSATVNGTGAGWTPQSVVIITVTPTGGQPVSSTQLVADGNGSFAISLNAPATQGTWQVCADGTGIDQAAARVCDTLTTKSPDNSTTTINGPVTTDTVTTSDTTPAPNPVPATPPAGDTPVTSTPDGASLIGDMGSGGGSSGPSGVGLTIGIGLGLIGVVAGAAAWKGLIGGRARPGVGIGVVVAALAGATGTVVASGSDTARIPGLHTTRVQSSALLQRGVPASTVSAVCPAGTVVIGGGYTTDWSSDDRSDVGYLINWLETTAEVLKNGKVQLRFVVPASVTSDGDAVRSQYLRSARSDRSFHLSDQIWNTGRESFQSYFERVVGSSGRPAYTIPWSPDVATAAQDVFYRSEEFYGRFAGVMVNESRPTDLGWSVTAKVSDVSLTKFATISVVALCAPLAATTGDDGVLGSRAVQAYANGTYSVARCNSDEVVTSTGWTVGKGVLASSAATADLSGTEVGGATEASDLVWSVCVKSEGLRVTTSSGSATTSAGYDGTASASCPTGSTATGGGFDVRHGTNPGAAVPGPHSILAATPSGAKTFTARVRGWLGGTMSLPTSAPADSNGVFGIHPRTSWENTEVSTIAVSALCIARTL